MEDLARKSRVSSPDYTRLLALAILALALAVRVVGLTWDAGYLLHPDERFLTIVAVDRIHWPGISNFPIMLDPAHSPLNPRAVGPDGHPQQYAYGSLPLYVVKVVAWIAGRWLHPAPLPHTTIAYVGRFLSALLDVATIALAMAFARRAYGRAAALLTGLLLALSVIMIQQAHFFVVDPWTTTFTMATLVCALQLAKTGRAPWALLSGAAFGAALTTKASILPLALPVLLAIAWPALFSRDRKRSSRARLAMAFVGAAGMTFLLIEPYAVLSPRPFLSDLLLQWQIATGRVDVPYTLQYVETTPGIYQIEQLVKWGLGPSLGIACLVAVFVAARRWWTARRPSDLILLSWIVAYSASRAGAETKYLRYLLPLVPALVILASSMLVSWTSRSRSGLYRAVPRITVAGVVLSTAVWALAFSSVYWQTHPRIAASRWMLDNIPRGASIGLEHWDDALPLNLDDVPNASTAFRTVSFNLYDIRPNEEAFDYIVSNLEQVDYIVLSSNRLAGSIPRVPWRYPVTAEYYRLLERGQLGFQLVYEARTLPHLGPLTIDDLSADESFTVYDHPRVRIYRKVQQLSRQELRERFAWALAQPFDPSRERPPEYKALLGRPASTIQIADDIGWSTPLTGFQPVAVVWWLLITTIVGVTVLPLALRLFPSFPDGGLGLVRLLGLIATGYLTWILVSLDVMPFTMPWLIMPAALVSVAASVAARLRPAQLASYLRPRRLYLAASEAVFWLTFLLFLTFRWLNPDLWHPIFGGEKPMELAYLNAVARSMSLPPYDPWFADGTMNYYYYGFFLVAYLWKLSGVAPEIGFQLSVATLAGLLASGLFSLGAAIGHALRPRGQLTWLYTLASGGLTVVLGLLTGNLDPLWQILSRNTLTIDFWQSSRAVTNAITEFPYFTFLWADLHPHAIAQPLIVLLLALVLSRWFEARQRLLAWSLLTAGAASLTAGSLAVTNTWDTPLAALLLTVLALAPALRQARFSVQSLVGGALLAVALVGASWFLFSPFFEHFVWVAGGLAPTTSGTPAGEYLTHFGVLLGLLATSTLWWLMRERSAWQTSIARAALFGAGTVGAGYCLGKFLFARELGIPLEVDWVGLVTALLVGMLAPFVALALTGGQSGHLELLVGVALLNATTGLLLALRPAAGVALIPAVLASVAVLRLRRRSALGFVTLVASAGLWITIAVDLVLIVDDLYRSPWERMNTVFKFYLEAWLLFAVAAGAAATWLFWTCWQALAVTAETTLGIISRWALPWRPPVTNLRVVGARAAPYLLILVNVFFLAAGLLYPALGTPQRLAQRMPTTPSPGSLDGYAWMKGAWIQNQLGEPLMLTGDYEAIQWLREHARGNPVIVEASIGPYRGNGARFSSATGLPAVLGWDRHERQQRQTPAVDQRLLDVRDLYQTTDLERKRWLLRRYGVRYVVVGDVERRWRIDPPFAGARTNAEPYASEAGLAAFQKLEGSLLRRVFQSGSTIIYEVLPFPALSPATNGASPT